MSDLREKLLAAKISTFEKTGSPTALAGAAEDAQMTSEASWWGSQLLSRLTLLAIPKQERRIRFRMIAAGRESLKKLEEIEYLLTSNKQIEAIVKYNTFVTQFLDTFVDDFTILQKLEKVRKSAPAQLPAATEPTVELSDEVISEREPPPPSEDPMERLRGLQSWITVQLDVKKRQAMEALQNRNAPEQIDKIRAYHNKLVRNYNNALKNEEPGQYEFILNDAQLFEQELDKLMSGLQAQDLEKGSYLIDDNIHKVAQNVVTRWIKRKLMELSPSMLQQIFLKIVDDLLILHPTIEEMMDRLEDRKLLMGDFQKDIKKILGTLSSVNDRFLLLAENALTLPGKAPFKEKLLQSLRQTARKIKKFEGAVSG